MERVIGVTDDGSEFIVADTRSVKYIKYLCGYMLRKAVRRVRKMCVLAREAINGKTT